MKHLLILAFLGLSLICCSSCRHNRLKTNEKELAKEIILQENEKTETERVALEKRTAENDNKSSIGLRLKENRSIDPDRPPILIDIIGTRKNTRKFKLSDIASSIRYVKLQTPPDTSLLYDPFYFRDGLDSRVVSDGDQIIFQGLFGLTRFNIRGEYQGTIWKNETGIKFYGKGAMFGGKDFFGVMMNFPVSLESGNLYFQFNDGPAGTGQAMKYKYGTNKDLAAQSKTEMPGLGVIPGDTLFNTNKHSQERFSWIYGTGPYTWAGLNNKWNAGTSGTFLVTYNENGDTVCKFKDFERIVNFNYTIGRTAVQLASYSYNNLLTIKQEYNDTVFRLIQPDRLLPVYIIDFGVYKFNYLA